MAGASEQTQRAVPQPTATERLEGARELSACGEQQGALLPSAGVRSTLLREPSTKLLRSTGLPIAPTIAEPLFWAAHHAASTGLVVLRS